MYACVLFVDFSSAFNTIVPKILCDKLFGMGVPKYLLSFISHFLTDRQQFVQINKNQSSVLSCDIGCPQGFVLSPIYRFYTARTH